MFPALEKGNSIYNEMRKWTTWFPKFQEIISGSAEPDFIRIDCNTAMMISEKEGFLKIELLKWCGCNSNLKF